MLRNTFQFLSRDLSHSTLVKMFYITHDHFFKQLDKIKIGYFSVNLKKFLSLKEHSILFKDGISIRIVNDLLYVTNQDDMIIFKVIDINSIIELIAINATIVHISSFKKMLCMFKEIFDEFHTGKCNITHSPSLIISIKIKDNDYIEIPPYIQCTLLDLSRCDKFIKPCELI